MSGGDEVFDEINKINRLTHMFESVVAYDEKGKMIDLNKWDEFLPEGTKEKVYKNGRIDHLDPITKTAISFKNIHARNAWICVQRDKGVFVRKPKD